MSRVPVTADLGRKVEQLLVVNAWLRAKLAERECEIERLKGELAKRGLFEGVPWEETERAMSGKAKSGDGWRG